MVDEDGGAPFLSLVVPAFDVGAYIGEFLDSLTAQTINRAGRTSSHPTQHDLDPRLEMVVVDDGSTDGTAAIVQAWLDTRAWFAVRYVRQENAGPAAARNTGLALARGTWVTSPDPDDLYRPDYLEVVLSELSSVPADVSLAAARILLLKDDRSVTDSHPLRAKFHGGGRVVDLDDEPEFVQLQTASTCYRRQVLVDSGLRLDPDVRPNFEDAFFTALFLDAAPTRKILLMPDAHYVYRRREDGSSVVQRSWGRHEKYDHLPRVGHLRLLQTFAARHGRVPVWVQDLVLYDLAFYFREDARSDSATANLPATVLATFHDLVREIFAHVDDEVLEDFAVIPLDPTLRQTLSIGYRHPGHVPDVVHVHQVDRRQQLAQVRYLHGPASVAEAVLIDGRPGAPLHVKTRDLVCFGRVLAHERTLWVPATASLGLVLDGRRVRVELGPPSGARSVVTPEEVWKSLVGRPVPPPGAPRLVPPVPEATPRRPGPTSAAPVPAEPVGAALPAEEAASEPATRSGVLGGLSRFARGRGRGRGGARGRDVEPTPTLPRPAGPPEPPEPPGPPEPPARSDAELVRLARSPEVVERFRDAWVFRDRDDWAQDNAEHLYRWVRAHHPEVNAWFVLRETSPDRSRLAAEGFSLVDPDGDDFVLLLKNAAHRVSSWADRSAVRPLDRGRFGGWGGRFTYLQHDVVHADVSRWLNRQPVSLLTTSTHDEHAALTRDHTPYVVTTKEAVLTGMPRHDRLLRLAAEADRHPWRLLLAPSADPGAWLEPASSPEVRAFAESTGLTLSVLVEPDAGPEEGASWPPGVDLVRVVGHDVQQVLADTALLVTDDSWTAFDVALLGRPVVYLRREPGVVDDDGRAGTARAWDVEADGFGPVVRSVSELVSVLRQHRGEDGTVGGLEVYRERAESAFAFRDGRCCERVYERILAGRRPDPVALLPWRSRTPDRGMVPAAVHEPSPQVSQRDGTG